jgi:uncharacterized membrane protein YccF (DUF307 family)
MRTLGNLLWLIFGGLETAIGYFMGGIGMMLTIIGIPFGLQAIKIGIYVIWPFGHHAVDSADSGGCLQTLMNVIWVIFFGLWIWLFHILFGLILCITIVGIPFGKKQFELSSLALTPFGKEVE